MSRENWNINDWKIRCSELAFEAQSLREALAGLMKLTSAAYGSQVTEIPEYVAALKAMRGEQWKPR